MEPRNGKPSNKCECDAKMIVHHHIDNTVSVEYHWQHRNHGEKQAGDVVISPITSQTFAESQRPTPPIQISIQ